MTRLREVLSDAETFVTRMPTEKIGLLFLQGSKVVQPDPGRLPDYQTHAGQQRGHWPSNDEITAAMFERAAHDKAYQQKLERQRKQEAEQVRSR